MLSSSPRSSADPPHSSSSTNVTTKKIPYWKSATTDTPVTSRLHRLSSRLTAIDPDLALPLLASFSPASSMASPSSGDYDDLMTTGRQHHPLLHHELSDDLRASDWDAVLALSRSALASTPHNAAADPTVMRPRSMGNNIHGRIAAAPAPAATAPRRRQSTPAISTDRRSDQPPPRRMSRRPSADSSVVAAAAQSSASASLSKRTRDAALSRRLFAANEDHLTHLAGKLLAQQATEPYFVSRALSVLIGCDSHYKRQRVLMALDQLAIEMQAEEDWVAEIDAGASVSSEEDEEEDLAATPVPDLSYGRRQPLPQKRQQQQQQLDEIETEVEDHDDDDDYDQRHGHHHQNRAMDLPEAMAAVYHHEATETYRPLATGGGGSFSSGGMSARVRATIGAAVPTSDDAASTNGTGAGSGITTSAAAIDAWVASRIAAATRDALAVVKDGSPATAPTADATNATAAVSTTTTTAAGLAAERARLMREHAALRDMIAGLQAEIAELSTPGDGDGSGSEEGEDQDVGDGAVIADESVSMDDGGNGEEEWTATTAQWLRDRRAAAAAAASAASGSDDENDDDDDDHPSHVGQANSSVAGASVLYLRHLTNHEDDDERDDQDAEEDDDEDDRTGMSTVSRSRGASGDALDTLASETAADDTAEAGDIRPSAFVLAAAPLSPLEPPINHDQLTTAASGSGSGSDDDDINDDDDNHQQNGAATLH
ncbi:hypothetical protein BC828DRAFT_404000 [Blastocladiella britannica]|nr:hypothetical protein BC828DRAFT_404000 [Blastocladiella britannica]